MSSLDLFAYFNKWNISGMEKKLKMINSILITVQTNC